MINGTTMTEWRKVKLGDVCDIFTGKKDVNQTVENGEYVFFSCSPKEFRSNDYLYNGEAIIIAGNGSYTGRVRFFSGKFDLYQRTYACVLKTSVNDVYMPFIYYVMKGKFEPRYLGGTRGSSIPYIVMGDLTEFPISLPPLAVQRKIAGVLGALDDKIELNNKINQNLELQAQALFKSWFVDKTNPNRKTIKAKEFFNITIGKTPPRKEPEWFSKNADNIKWVSISDMGNCGMYISDSSEYLVPESISKFNVKIVPDNTVLLSFKLTVGRIAITDGEMATNEAIAHFGTDKKEINEYLYYYLKNFNFQTMGSTSSIATAVNSKIIKSMPFIMPEESELKDFHSVISPMFAQIKANQRENLRLSELRDTLLPKLMSGEIDVDRVDIFTFERMQIDNDI